MDFTAWLWGWMEFFHHFLLWWLKFWLPINIEKISRISRKYREYWENIENIEKISRILRKYREYWGNIENIEKILRKYREYRENTDEIIEKTSRINTEEISGAKRSIKITDHSICISANAIHCITCTLCKKMYVGERGRRLGHRIQEYLRGIEKDDKNASRPVARQSAAFPYIKEARKAAKL